MALILEYFEPAYRLGMTATPLRDENRDLREALGQRYQFENIVGHSPEMQEIFATVTRVAPTRATVLLAGESGVGKDMIARAILFVVCVFQFVSHRRQHVDGFENG